MPVELLANAASTTLASAVASGATTTFTVASSAGFPAPVAGASQFRAVVTNASTGVVVEYVTVTAVSGTTWTVTRASEDAVRFPAAAIASGALVGQVMTAAGLALLDGRLAGQRTELSKQSTAAVSDGITGFATFGTSFTTVSFATQSGTTTTTVDPSGNFDTATQTYVVPFTGLYLCSASFRLADGPTAGGGSAANLSYGVGVHTSNVDGPWFAWDFTAAGSASSRRRKTTLYQRYSSFTAGDRLRLFAYVDGSATQLTAASLFITPLRTEQ